MGCSIKCEYGYNRCCVDCEERPTCGGVCENMDKYEYTCECPEWVDDEEEKKPMGKRLKGFLYKLGLVPRKDYEDLVQEGFEEGFKKDEMCRDYLEDKFRAEKKALEYERLIIGMLQQHLIYQKREGNRYIIVPQKSLDNAGKFKLSVKEEYGSDRYHIVGIEELLEEEE